MFSCFYSVTDVTPYFTLADLEKCNPPVELSLLWLAAIGVGFTLKRIATIAIDKIKDSVKKIKGND